MAVLDLSDIKIIMRYYHDKYSKTNPDVELINSYDVAIRVVESERLDFYILDELTEEELNTALDRISLEYNKISMKLVNGEEIDTPNRFTAHQVREAYTVVVTLLKKFKDYKIRDLRRDDDQIQDEVTMNEDDKEIEYANPNLRDAAIRLEKALEKSDKCEFTRIYKIEFLDYIYEDEDLENYERTIEVENPFLITEWEIPQYIPYGIKSLEFVGYMK